MNEGDFMRIGNVDIDNKVFLAPMAGVTDLPFRLLCKEMNCGLLYTEMINAKALCYDDVNTKSMLKMDPKEHPVNIQIFGSEVEYMGKAAYILNEYPNELSPSKRTKSRILNAKSPPSKSPPRAVFLV